MSSACKHPVIAGAARIARDLTTMASGCKDAANAARTGDSAEPLASGADGRPSFRHGPERQYRIAIPRNSDSVRPLFGDMLLCVNGDRKSTRLNSSHVEISYAVFC